MANKITNYRRIQNWENFFLDSALYSVVNSIGIEYDNDFTPIAAITGDLFTYMYSDRLPCDSGLTNYVAMPDVVLKAYDSFGWNCEYLSREDVNRDLAAALRKIKISVDRGLPVLAWGVGGVVCADGTRYDPMGEGALIGGYDDDVLLVHLYCGAERLSPVSYGGRPGVDEHGYTAISAKDALATTNGLFIPTEKKKQTDYKRLSDLTQQLWDLHGGFMPALHRMQEHEFRKQLAAVLHQMGICCDGIMHRYIGCA